MAITAQQHLAQCEEHELQNAGAVTEHEYTVHLLACLRCNELEAARFLWQRLPASIRPPAATSSAASTSAAASSSTSLLHAVHRMASSLLADDVASFYTAADFATALVATSTASATVAQREECTTLIAATVAETRAAWTWLLPRAFRVLSVADVARKLGFRDNASGHADAAAHARALGWAVDDATAMVRPVVTAAAAAAAKQRAMASSAVATPADTTSSTTSLSSSSSSSSASSSSSSPSPAAAPAAAQQQLAELTALVTHLESATLPPETSFTAGGDGKSGDGGSGGSERKNAGKDAKDAKKKGKK